MIVRTLQSKWLLVYAALLLLGIGAAIYANQAAYQFCVGGELAANWLCNYGKTQQFNVTIYSTPKSAAISDTTITRTQTTNLPRPWNGKERVNILLMGIDQRQGEAEPAYRTDTMLVLTLDPVTMQAGMLSIPRDLWVPIPGYDNGRINTANFLGDAYDYPGGGSALARKTVEHVLGIPINFYARINFTAFEEFVDRMGGITVNVPEDIYDPEYPTENYGVEVFSITAGLHQMDGKTALKFARTRHSLANGDFDRARNQQLVLLATKDKLGNPEVFLSLLASGSDLITRLNTSVKTDLSLDQIQQLAALAQKVDRKNIKSAVLDQNYTEFATTLTDPPQQVQVPVRARIAELRESFFATEINGAVESNTPTPSVNATPVTTEVVTTNAATDAWKSEGAKIVLLNGTLNAGYAQKVADALAARGFTIVRVGNSPDNRFDYETSVVTDYGGKQGTANALMDTLQITTSANMKRLLVPNAEADIVVVLGSDVKIP